MGTGLEPQQSVRLVVHGSYSEKNQRKKVVS